MVLHGGLSQQLPFLVVEAGITRMCSIGGLDAEALEGEIDPVGDGDGAPEAE